MDYARAIQRYYGGSQQRMVERLDISKSWLSRYLELAKLPAEIVNCFDSPHVIRVTHAAKLAPALSNPVERRRVLDIAAAIQAERSGLDRPSHPPASIVSRLLAIKKKPGSRVPAPFQLRDESGRVLATMIQQPKGTISITVPAARTLTRTALSAAVETCLDELFRDR
jgi:ParB family chromosome partitioning protein